MPDNISIAIIGGALQDSLRQSYSSRMALTSQYLRKRPLTLIGVRVDHWICILIVVRKHCAELAYSSSSGKLQGMKISKAE